jgi:hypothetical protein
MNMSGALRLSSDAALCQKIDQMIFVSLRNNSRPIFPVQDAAAILMQQHHLAPEQRAELIALISQRCIGKHVPLAFNDHERSGGFDLLT